MVIFYPLVGFELRTSRFAVKLKSTFFKAFASPLLAFQAKLVHQNSYSYPPLAGRAHCGCQLLTNQCMGRVDCIQSSNFHCPIAWDYSTRYDTRFLHAITCTLYKSQILESLTWTRVYPTHICEHTFTCSHVLFHLYLTSVNIQHSK